jgi:hypothetical protein
MNRYRYVAPAPTVRADVVRSAGATMRRLDSLLRIAARSTFEP